MKVLANDGISAVGVEKLQAAGFEVKTDKVAQEDLASFINSEDVAVLLVRSATKVRQDLIDSCPGLKFIGRGGVGMDNIDVEYARSKGITVENTPAASSRSVAELVFAHLFSVARGLHQANRTMPVKGHTDFKSLKKAYGKGIELYGKTMGIIGFGRIGRSVAQYALGCGMNVIFHDPFVTNAVITVTINGQNVEVNLSGNTMDEVLSGSDFISLHIPMPDSGHVIGMEELQKMKDGSVLVNLARGGVVDEDALLTALNDGKLRAACLDVFVGEPEPREDLLHHDNISLSPHIGAATGEAQDRIGEEMADKIIAAMQVVS